MLANIETCRAAHHAFHCCRATMPTSPAKPPWRGAVAELLLLLQDNPAVILLLHNPLIVFYSLELVKIIFQRSASFGPQASYSISPLLPRPLLLHHLVPLHLVQLHLVPLTR